MNDYTEGGGGMGCMLQIAAIGLALMALMALAGGDTTTTSTTTTSDTRSGVLSGNQTELLSRNQLNLFSEVWNCFGDNSCIITTELITNTTTTIAPVSVEGDRNIVSGGLRMCVDANGWGYQTDQPCRDGYQEQAQP